MPERARDDCCGRRRLSDEEVEPQANASQNVTGRRISWQLRHEISPAET
jgi:hypothetical protein